MNIEQAYKERQQTAEDYSFGILAERCEKSTVYPYGFKVAEPCRPDETVVLALTGETSNDRFRECNGFLKRFDNFVHSFKEFHDVRCITDVTCLGSYFYKDAALNLLKTQAPESARYGKPQPALPPATQKEITAPRYVDDIYNFAVAPRISSGDGKIRLPLAQALRNIRKLQVVTYCLGSFTALKLEERLVKHMTELGYTKSEREQITSQLLVLNYSPDVPLGLSQAKNINIASLSDLRIYHCNYIKELVHFNFQVATIPPIYLPTRHGGIFYCAAYNQNELKKNNTIVVKKIGKGNNFFQQMYARPDKENYPIHEHDFLGFEEMKEMSKGAKNLQTYGKNILVAGIKNALKQPQAGYTPLPSTKTLAAHTIRQKIELYQYWLGGKGVLRMVNRTDKDFLLQNSFASRIKTVSLD